MWLKNNGNISRTMNINILKKSSYLIQSVEVSLKFCLMFSFLMHFFLQFFINTFFLRNYKLFIIFNIWKNSIKNSEKMEIFTSHKAQKYKCVEVCRYLKEK